MSHVNILLTVDWEADHGPWQNRPDGEDYGGVLVGTGALTSILDDLSLACTWLVECHADIEDRDLVRLFPERIRQLDGRPRDEVGVHIHWVRREAGQDRYPLQDTPWIGRQVGYAAEALGALGLPPHAFRSGGFLRVPSLPAVLEAHGYTADATYTEARLPRRLVASPAQPYRCDPGDLSRPGTSHVIEFPTHFRVTGRTVPWLVDRLVVHHARTLSRRESDTFLTLYLHIDELTRPGSGHDERAEVDEPAVGRLRTLLTHFLEIDRVAFVTMDDARRLYAEQERLERIPG